jgi:DNA-binding MarR family transcriptional regulator
MARLTPEEQHAWRSLAMMMQLVEMAADKQAKRDGGIPHGYYRILVLLWEAPGRRMQLKAIAAKTGFEQSRLSHALNSMENSGWIVRESSEGPRRATDAVLTALGQNLVRRVSPKQALEVRARVFSKLSPEQVDQLAQISELIVRSLEEG